LTRIKENEILEKLNLIDHYYTVITTHRQENIENKENVQNIVDAIIELEDVKIVFPIHPRAKKRLLQLDLLDKIKATEHIFLIPPVGYYEMLKLIMNSKALLTDSGGMQKEAFWLKTWCVTLRETTEWVETVKAGANVLVGSSKNKIITEVKKALDKEQKEKIFDKTIYGEGNSAKKIIHKIKEHLVNR
jgi:UDP-N-acetylglucosamine 2-epimerase